MLSRGEDEEGMAKGKEGSPHLLFGNEVSLRLRKEFQESSSGQPAKICQEKKASKKI